jgi:hypothetical protein
VISFLLYKLEFSSACLELKSLRREVPKRGHVGSDSLFLKHSEVCILHFIEGVVKGHPVEEFIYFA